MSKEIFIELRSALYPPENITISVNRGEERIEQIYSGIKKFLSHFDLLTNKEKCQIFFVDNTIESKDSIPKKIKEILEENNIIQLVQIKNYYGSKNKGAGDIDIWRENLNIMSDFKWILHFEPRTILNSSEFINKCLTSPSNLFKILRPDNTGEHFYTGLFMMDIEDLKDYINSINLDTMVNNCISIEYSLFEFMQSFKFNKFKEYTKKLKVTWNDSHENRFIEF